MAYYPDPYGQSNQQPQYNVQPYPAPGAAPTAPASKPQPAAAPALSKGPQGWSMGDTAKWWMNKYGGAATLAKDANARNQFLTGLTQDSRFKGAQITGTYGDKLRLADGRVIDYIRDVDRNPAFAWHVAAGPGGAPVARPGGVSGGGSSRSSTSVSAASMPQGVSKELWNMLLSRAKQGTDVSRDDPNIRTQADAFTAQQDRSRRQFLAEQAERSSPFATGAQLGQERMTAERAGQASGAFEAQLMGQEINAKRQEIMHALDSMRGLLTAQQEMALRKELATMDDALRRLQLNQQHSQFTADLGLRAEDRAAYWDALRRGQIGG